jgi:hypothetical protein
MSKDAVRFYVTYPEQRFVRTNGLSSNWYWRPLSQDRCVSFSDFDLAEQALKWVIGNARSSAAVWTKLGTFTKEVYADDILDRIRDRVYTATHSGGVVFAADNFHYMRERVPRTPPPSCVCVAIAFHLGDAAGLFPARRDIRLFVGNHGTPPYGPNFEDLPEQDDENLVAGSVLRLAAISALG